MSLTGGRMDSMIEQVLYFLRKRSTAFTVEKIQKSCRVLPVDLEEMLCWAESLRIPSDGRFDTMNLVFHQLPSGHFALGRLRQVRDSVDAASHSRHGAARGLYCLQYFIVDSEQLHLFGNNPILLFRRTLSLEPNVLSYPCDDPRAVTLASDTCFFDARQLRALCAAPGPESMAYLTDQVLHRPVASFISSTAAPHVVSGVLNLLPVDYRPEISFALELDFSKDRCLRLAGFTRKERAVPKRWSGALIDLDTQIDATNLGGWASYAYQAFLNNGYKVFERRLIERHREIRRYTLQGDCWFPPSAEELDRQGKEGLDALKNSLGQEYQTNAPAGPDLADPRVFKLRRTKGDNPRLTIPEKLRRWLLEARPDEEIFTESIGGDGTEKDCDVEIPDLECIEEIEKDSSTDNANHTGNTGNIGLEALLRAAGELSRQERQEKSNEKEGNSEEESNSGNESNNEKDTVKEVYGEPLFVYEGKNRLFSPYQRLLAMNPAYEKELLDLDAHIAKALGGDRASVLDLAVFWRQFSRLTNNELFGAAQEEYIHYLRTVLVNGPDQVTGDIRGTIAALDVIDILFDKDYA